MARERTADDSTTESGDASGGASLLDRESYRQLANTAVGTVVMTGDEMPVDATDNISTPRETSNRNAPPVTTNITGLNVALSAKGARENGYEECDSFI
ncbi:hypothetical protein ACFO0N_07590 [Halobium salinum]|uniref:Uncharacterized protein n=1 Tax=Halobium salinum TaxID=1364940 RepID=A0ABD5PAQ2_9EURY|nr:hypothetical protein [Halobium salinum]